MTTPPTKSGVAGSRLLSLDAFRGLVIVVMFLVNVAGRDDSFPSWIPHRGWNGGAMGNGLADYVFPWFLFIVGASIPFSMRFGRGAQRTSGQKLWSAARRGACIYLFGTLLWCATIGYRPTDPEQVARWAGPITWRVILHWDILPLIGLAYFLGVCLYLPRGSTLWRASFVGVVLTAKYALLRLVPYPGAGADGAVIWEQTRSAQSWVNGQLGWLGVALTQGLPATSCVVLGSMASDWLVRHDVTPRRKAGLLASAGVLGYALGLLAHATAVMPQSKDFFTSSYVVGTVGAASTVLALMYWLVDVRGLTTLWVLRIYGLNAMAAYLGAELVWKMVLTRWEITNPPSIGESSMAIVAIKAHLQETLGTHAGSWAVVGGYIVFWWWICRRLDRRGVYLRV